MPSPKSPRHHEPAGVHGNYFAAWACPEYRALSLQLLGNQTFVEHLALVVAAGHENLIPTMLLMTGAMGRSDDIAALNPYTEGKMQLGRAPHQGTNPYTSTPTRGV